LLHRPDRIHDRAADLLPRRRAERALGSNHQVRTSKTAGLERASAAADGSRGATEGARAVETN